MSITRFKKSTAVIFVFSITYSCASYAGSCIPENYDECIYDGMKGVGSDVAARAIAAVCANKFSQEFAQRKIRDINNITISKVKNDIRVLESALMIYRLDNYAYPTTDQGLEALVSKPTSLPKPPNWKQGGYIKKLYSDPWGNSYLYLNPGDKGEIDIYSLGADGVPGGEGINKDIGNWVIK